MEKRFWALAFLAVVLIGSMASIGFVLGESSPTPSPTPSPSASPTPSLAISETTFPPGYVLSREGEYVPGKLIVKLREGFSISSLDEINYRFGAVSVAREFPGFDSTEKKIERMGKKYPIRFARAKKDIDISKIRLEAIYEINFPEYMNMESVAEEYTKLSGVEYAHPVYFRYPEYVPTEKRYNEQWAHQKIQSELAWDIEKGDSSVIVAVDDTGVDYDHDDLKTNIWKNPDEEVGDFNGDGCPGICGVDDDGDGLIDEDSQGCGSNGLDGKGNSCVYRNDLDNDDDENGYADDIRGWDLMKDDNDPMDSDSHGTAVSGIIAAVENGEGVIGICFKCTIMPVKALGVGGVKYAADNGADIVSNSYGGYGYMQEDQDIINYAASLGVIVVASAGNDNTDKHHYPSSYDNTISVAAVGANDIREYYSNYGDDVDVSAPAGVLSIAPDNEYYEYFSGTSAATPHVSGLIGLLLSKNPAITVEEVEYIITNEADYFGIDIPAADKYIGKGRINALKALQKVSSMVELPSYKAEILSPRGGSVFLTKEIKGIATGNSYKIEVGEGYYPTTWSIIGSGLQAQDEVIGTLDTTKFKDSQILTIKLTVEGDKESITDSVRIMVDNIFIEEPNRQGYYRYGDKINIKATIRYETPDYILEYSRDIEPRIWSSEGLEYSKEGNIITGTWDSSKLHSIGTYILRLRSTKEGIESIDEQIIAFDNYLKGWPKKVDGLIDRASPVAADLDRDGKHEIIIGTKKPGKIYVFRYDGSFAPGWENGKDLSGDVFSSVAVANMDSDPELEIIVNALGGLGEKTLFVFNYDGTYVKGWPVGIASTFSTSPVVYKKEDDNKILIGMYDNGLEMLNSDGTEDTSFINNVVGSVFSSPVYGDILKDVLGDEIVVMSCGPCADRSWEEVKAKTHIYLLRSDGSIVWQKEFEGREDLTPVLGDVNGDGSLEILASLPPKDSIHMPAINIFDSYGNILDVIGAIQDSSVALGDFGDSKIRIAAAYSTKVWARIFPPDPIWWINHWNGDLIERMRFSGPIVGDINEDNNEEETNNKEVIIGVNGKVYAYQNHKPPFPPGVFDLVDNWPKTVDGLVATVPAMGDIDGDGNLDIVVATYPGSIYVYDLDTPYDPAKIEWPMFQHDTWHSGQYGFVPDDRPLPSKQFIRGDANSDGKVDMSDAIRILEMLFQQGELLKCLDAGDVNDDGFIDISDPIYILLYLFNAGKEPPAPFSEAGIDMSEDGLYCQ